MTTEQRLRQSSPISDRGRDDDEHPLPPGPWDPVIRIALEGAFLDLDLRTGISSRLTFLAARFPEIWDIIPRGGQFGASVELNPQPFPPRYAFLIAFARAIVYRAELIQDIAGSASGEGDGQGSSAAGGYIVRLADEICGNDRRFRYPFPGPPPHWWFFDRFSGSELVVLAIEFENAAKQAYGSNLRGALAATSAKLAATALTRQSAQ